MKEVKRLQEENESIRRIDTFLSMSMMQDKITFLQREVDKQKIESTELDSLRNTVCDLKIKNAQLTHYYSVVYNRLTKIEKENDVLITENNSISLCPILLIEIKNPVRNLNCKHIYSYEGITGYLKDKRGKVLCPQYGCNAMINFRRNNL